jgi:hypothetical protein
VGRIIDGRDVMQPPRPDLSIVIVTPDTYATIRSTIVCLRRQTVRDRIELVIVAPSAAALKPSESELADFLRCEIVEVGTVRSIGSANAAGIRRASASVVALCEDHVIPAPDWAEHLIAAHREPWAAVGVAIRNGNPDSRISWADLLIGYSTWLEPVNAGVADFLPGHNSSYKRGTLLEYADQLETLMEAETVLHWDLRRKGHQLYLEPKARIAHVNFSRLPIWTRVQFHAGRVFAAARARDQRWSVGRRALFVCGSPLIPLVRLRRIARHASRAESLRRSFVRALPALLFGLVIDGAGQMVGYMAGAGGSAEALSRFEFHRYHYNRRHPPTADS